MKLQPTKWPGALALLAVTLLLAACASAPAPDATAYNLYIPAEGIYKLTLADLGWEAVPTEQIDLRFKNEPVPIRIVETQGETAILFYGQASSSPYTATNIYQIQIAAAENRRMTTAAAETPTTPPAATIDTKIRFEENQRYAPLYIEGENWFWEKLFAPQIFDYSFNLPELADDAAALTLSFWGQTDTTEEPDHHVIVAVNEQEVANSFWDGQTTQIITAEIPAGLLRAGANRVSINLPGDTGALIDSVNLNWIEFTIPQTARFENAARPFSGPGGDLQFDPPRQEFELYDITAPAQIQFQTIRAENTIAAIQTDHTYLAASLETALAVPEIRNVSAEPDLKDPNTNANYVVIGADAFHQALAPLLDLRQEQGLTPLLLRPQTIYDQFNSGMPEPEAIRLFLQFAAENWVGAPQYVVLVGDASYDGRGYQTPPEAHFLPTQLIATSLGGETGSDLPLVNLDADPWPEIAVGRIPARSADQVTTLVEKTIAFERQTAVPTAQNSIVVVADGQEAHFKAEAQGFIDSFPKNYPATLLAPEPGDPAAAGQIQAYFAQNPLLVAYFGHGSLKMWGKDQLFIQDGVAALENRERQAVILHITCLSGLFTHPEQESLVETLLWQPSGGAVANIGPTSLTLPHAQQALTTGFVENWLSSSANSPRRLGDLMLAAWQNMPENNQSNLDVLNTFLLFGDPALLLPPLDQ